jgi:BRCA1-associated protein
MNTNANAKMSPCLDIAEFKRGRSLSTPSEKQNCAVCLEPMDFSSIKKEKETNSPTGSSMGLTVKKDVSSSSIFTTVCNHSFHTDCLLRCQDSPCPVCRYDHSGLDETLSQCHICGTTERIHICLICGVASCWKGEQQPNNQISSNTKNNAMGKGVESWDTHGCDSRGHARRHYDETLHAYALDTETQHVWDFAGQGYVHRLIQNVDDGKIVEISDPHSGAMERSLIPELSDTQEGEVVHRKLEGYASEYYTLLKSQLEQQRVYYEDIMEQIRREHKTESKGNGSSELIAALKQDRNQIQQRCQVLQRKRNKVVDDVAFLKNMNESLEANKEPLKRQIRLLQNQRKETANMLQRRQPELEEKVQRLMLELENGG